MLGIRHGISAKKNFMLMTSSFALSIVLFLSFSVLIELIGCLIPQSSSMPDIEITSADRSDWVSSALVDRLNGMTGVKRAFGRRSLLGAPAEGIRQSNTVDMISYDEYDLDCLTKDKQLRKGSDIAKVYGDSNYVLAVWDEDRPLEIGDQIQVGGEALEIAGLLRYNPFSSDGGADGKTTLIASGKTFTRLTGITDYSLILVQTTKEITDEDVMAMRDVLGEDGVLHDKRDQRTTGTYIAFRLFVYGFLAIITLVTVLNIMNSISMSVFARIGQYGAMRAVGMDQAQLIKMIAAEAVTYALSGCVFGCMFGLLISKWLYDTLITAHFGYATWHVPVGSLVTILLFVLAAVIAAVYAPSKKIRHMSVVETLNTW